MEPIRKITHGWVTQEFDPETGQCLSQEFYAGELIQWEDVYGNEISLTEEVQKKCYHIYDMAEVYPTGLKGFKCPKCGSNRVEEVMTGVTQASEVVDVEPFDNPKGFLCQYGYATYDGEDPMEIRYQCLNCGHPVSEEILREIAGKNMGH